MAEVTGLPRKIQERDLIEILSLLVGGPIVVRRNPLRIAAACTCPTCTKKAGSVPVEAISIQAAYFAVNGKLQRHILRESRSRPKAKVTSAAAAS